MIESSPRLIHKPGGANILFKKKYLYHEQFPESHAIDRASSFSIKDKTILILPSPLLGYGIKETLSRLPANSYVVCIEKEESLMKITLENFIPSFKKDPRVTFLRTESVEAVMDHIQRIINLSDYRRVILIPLNRGYLLHRFFYDEVRERLLKEIQTRLRNRLTLLRLGRRWMSNLFRNLEFVPYSAPLSKLIIDKPPLVIGAGESLEEGYGWLKSIKSRVYIIAVDTALPPLRALGIIPDLVVSVDSQATNLQDFIGYLSSEITLAADLTVFPSILRHWKGPTYLFLSKFEPLQWFEKPTTKAFLPPLLPPLGSVGNISLYIAETYSPKSFPIFVLGMDFCYSPLKPHALGTYSHSLFLRRHDRLLSPLIETLGRTNAKEYAMDGHRVHSDMVLLSFREVARTICQMAGRIYALSKHGLDFGATYTPTIDRVLSSVENKCKTLSANTYLQMECIRTDGWNEGEVLQFIEKLSAELTQLETELSRATRPEELPSLGCLDFLFLDLPVQPTPQTLHSQTIPPLVKNIRYYKRLLTLLGERLNPRTF